MERRFSDRPRFTPAFMVNDYIAGNLGNAGVIAAFRRRAREGGSYHVRVNVSRCAMWLMSLGQVDEAELANPGPEALGSPETIRPMTPDGDYKRLSPLVKPSARRRAGASYYWTWRWGRGRPGRHRCGGQPFHHE
jgi:crotonobetainyl-CoA:carnitine CoA-transferase CaiB-like acyl-CoA transferase